MSKLKRNAIDKLNTLLFGKDLRVTEGEPYTRVRDYDFSSYYPENNYIYDEAIPSENVFDIRDFGASVDNDDNAEFINEAIVKASESKGTVLVKGGDFVTTTVTLLDDVTLFICRDSSLCANETGIGYKPYGAVLYANGVSNIKLCGGGKIKGNGNLFGRQPVANANYTKPAEYIDVIKMRQDYRAQLRFAHESKYGGLICIKYSKGVTVDNFILENSAYWTFKLVDTSDVSIKNFVINNNRNVANADGIDIAGGWGFDIEHCFISTADDGIVIKNAIWLGNKGAMGNINITDCEIISRTNAIKVGTETTYDISNININNCKLFMTDVYPGSVSGISLEACDGTVLSNVTIDDIIMDRCTCPIFIRLGNRNRAAEVNSQSANAIEFGAKAQKGGESDKNLFNMKSAVRDIKITNVRATGVELPVIIAGYRQGAITKRVENVILNNIDLEYVNIPEIEDKRLFIPEYVKEYPEGWRFRNLPAYAIWTRHTRNITITNFSCTHPQKTWKKHTVKIDNK